MYWIDILRTLNVPNAAAGRNRTSGYKWADGTVNRTRRSAINSFVALLALLNCLGGAIAQSDPFIDTIDKVKRSVGGVVCVNENPPRVFNITSFDGTAFIINETGTFLTAAHVVKDFLPAGSLAQCGAAAIYLSPDRWGTGRFRWQRFLPEECVFDGSADISQCKTTDDLTTIKDLINKPPPLIVDDGIKPDGTAVAFTGFPLNAVVPYTSRANILAYPPPPKPNATVVIIDKTAWPGASGSPVYQVDGKVIGLIIQRGDGVASGIAVAVDGRTISRFINAHANK